MAAPQQSWCRANWSGQVASLRSGEQALPSALLGNSAAQKLQLHCTCTHCSKRCKSFPKHLLLPFQRCCHSLLRLLAVMLSCAVAFAVMHAAVCLLSLHLHTVVLAVVLAVAFDITIIRTCCDAPLDLDCSCGCFCYGTLVVVASFLAKDELHRFIADVG